MILAQTISNYTHKVLLWEFWTQF